MERMHEWIAANHEVASLLVSVAMLLVWVTYLQAFLGSYRRQRTGTILITLGQGRGLEAHCLVTNMSAEPVYIFTVIAQVEGRRGVRSGAITEPDGEHWSEPSDLRLWTRQGPLESGDLRDMGTLRSMLEHVLQAGTGTGARTEDPGDIAAGLTSLVIRVIAMHGSDDVPMGAERAFDVVGEGAELALRPHSHGTRQMRSRRERRRLSRLLDEDPGTSAPN